MTTPQPVRFPTAILLVGAGYGFLAALLSGFANLQTPKGSIEDNLLLVLGIVVWALSVLYWHGLALVSWRYRTAIIAAVVVPSVLLSLVLGYLNDSFVQILFTQIGLIGSALVTGTLTRSVESPAKRWLYGAAVSLLATGTWLIVDYDRIMSTLTPTDSVAVSSGSTDSTGVQTILSDSTGLTGIIGDTAKTTPMNADDSIALYGISFRTLTERLLPGSLIVSELTPVAVGGVLFARSVSALQGAGAALPSLRIPFGLMPVLTAALVVRLLLDEPFTRVADNVILVLLLVYLVGGIALVSFLMSHFHWPFPIRLGSWMLLVLFSVYLFPLLMVAGLVDSFLDLRTRLSTPAEPLSS